MASAIAINPSHDAGMAEPSFHLGFDIGGTKCAVSLGHRNGQSVRILHRQAFSTTTTRTPETTIRRLVEVAVPLTESLPAGQRVRSIGISCGGPLDSRRGVILGPPNLPGWDEVPITQMVQNRMSLPTFLENDANACALAEWRWGAGRCSHMVFLTFGTGMGAGLILNNQLYRGACDLAGEVGHMRLSKTGPMGFGKAGSFEGFCSGGGILEAARRAGLFDVADAQACFVRAARGDSACLKLVEEVGRRLGRGLAILIDLLNPQKIVIGSIFARQESVLRPWMEEELRREALPAAVAACEIVPAALGESLGDYAALAVAMRVAETINVSIDRGMESEQRLV